VALRVITSVIGFPLLAFFLVRGGWPLQLMVLVVSLVAIYELFNAISGKRQPVQLVAYAAAALFYVLQKGMTADYFLIFTTVFLLATLLFSVIFYTKVTLQDCMATVFVFFYAVVLLSFICLVRGYRFGQYFVWLIFISAWGSDTFAYFTGKLLGKHPLAPRLSPKKTVEGAVGGVLGAALLAFLYGLGVSWLMRLNDTQLIVIFTVVGAVGAVFSQFGDLSASVIKRQNNIKDYGKIIPGHGGVMDRFDSVLFTAPGVYIFMVFLLNSFGK